MKVCVIRRQFYTSELNTTTTVYAEPGFGTPKAAIIQYVTTVGDIDVLDTSTIQQSFGIGYAAGSGTTALNSTISHTQVDAVGTSTSRVTGQASSGPLYTQGSGSGTSNIWRSTSCRFIDGGMILTFAAPSTGGTPPPNQQLDAIFTFFTGADLQVQHFHYAVATNTGIGRTFDAGFRPDLIIGSAMRATAGGNQSFSFGYATRDQSGISSTAVSTQGSCASFFSTAAATMLQFMRHSRYFAEQCPVTVATQGTPQTAWQVDYFTSTGFHAIVRNANHPVGAILSCLAFKFDNKFYGSSYNTITSIGGEVINTGFVPQFIIGASTGCSTQNLVSAPKSPDSDAFSVFVGTGGTASKSRQGIGTISVTNGTTTVTGTGTSFRAQLSEGNALFNSSGTRIGAVGSINSNTSFVLKGGALAGMSNENFFYRGKSQFSTVIGNEYGNTNSIAYTGQLSDIEWVRSTGGVPSTWIQARINPFNRKSRFTLSYDTVDSIPRWGWFLAIGDENRRSTGNI